MSTKQRLAHAIAELPDSLSIEEAVERLYRAFKLKRAAQASARSSLPPEGRRSFEQMYTAWRDSVDPDDLITDDDDPFVGARSKSRGREIEL